MLGHGVYSAKQQSANIKNQTWDSTCFRTSIQLSQLFTQQELKRQAAASNCSMKIRQLFKQQMQQRLQVLRFARSSFIINATVLVAFSSVLLNCKWPRCYKKQVKTSVKAKRSIALYKADSRSVVPPFHFRSGFLFPTLHRCKAKEDKKKEHI